MALPSLGVALPGLVGLSRYAYPTFNVEGVDATNDWNASLLSFCYKEGIGDDKHPACTADISLADPEGKMRTTYRMKGGQRVIVTLVAANWNYPGEVLARPLGYLEVQAVEIQQSKSHGTVFQIKLTSMPVTSDLRLTKKTKAHEKTTLRDIAQDVANSNKMKLNWDASIKTNPPIARGDIHNHSDMFYLKKLCSQHDLLVRTENGTLFITSHSALENQAPSWTLVAPSPTSLGGVNGAGGIISWTFKETTEDTYAAAISSVADNRTGKTTSATATDPAKKAASNNPGAGPTLMLNSGYNHPESSTDKSQVLSADQINLSDGGAPPGALTLPEVQ